LRAAFEDRVSKAIEEMIQPLPEDIGTLLGTADFGAWQRQIQSRRQMTDREFFERFFPHAPEPILRSTTRPCAD